MSKEIKTMVCPFDPSHVMPYERFLNHLEKCKFPKKKEYAKCKYNPYHVLHKAEIEQHQRSITSIMQTAPTAKSTRTNKRRMTTGEQRQKKLISSAIKAASTRRIVTTSRRKLSSTTRNTATSAP